jgi:hypothetical protein
MAAGLVHEIENYVGRVLHQGATAFSLPNTYRLPVFIERLYQLYDFHISTNRFVLFVVRHRNLNIPTPSELAKHVQIIRNAIQLPAIFGSETITSPLRARLIEHRVPFVVPNNQLYLPELAMDLREHFRPVRTQALDKLSPAAQVVVFHFLLKLDPVAQTPSALAHRLHYSAMSIGRAFDELTASQLAETKWVGHERRVVFRLPGRELFNAAQSMLRNPVRKIRNFQGSPLPNLKLSGESALARLTDLAMPAIPTYAVSAAHWRVIESQSNLSIAEAGDSEFAIETWAYDPGALTKGAIVDHLSLYAEFMHHGDERVAGAAEKLLEQIPW